jgi:hypothetical protein
MSGCPSMEDKNEEEKEKRRVAMSNMRPSIMILFVKRFGGSE